MGLKKKEEEEEEEEGGGEQQKTTQQLVLYQLLWVIDLSDGGHWYPQLVVSILSVFLCMTTH